MMHVTQSVYYVTLNSALENVLYSWKEASFIFFFLLLTEKSYVYYYSNYNCLSGAKAQGWGLRGGTSQQTVSLKGKNLFLTLTIPLRECILCLNLN